jgi:hypothetical protein
MSAINAVFDKDRPHSLIILLVLLLMLFVVTLSTSVHASTTHINVGGPIISDTTWALANRYSEH